jgi:hypothetical protein
VGRGIKEVTTDRSKLYKAPLHLDIEELVKRFGLPQQMEDRTKRYLRTGDEGWLTIRLVEPRLISSSIDLSESIPSAHFTVAGLIPWITKKQWIDIWNLQVEPYLKEVNRTNKRLLDKWQRSRKRATITSLDEQMKRWAEWYDLVKNQGLTLRETADRWNDMYPDADPDKVPDESTISKAIQEFEEAIRPTDIKG